MLSIGRRIANPAERGDPATIAASGLLIPFSNVIDPHAAFQNGPDGNIVYSSTNYQNNWDGKDTSGKELVDGFILINSRRKVGKLGMVLYIY